MSLAVLLSIGSVGITGCGSNGVTDNAPVVEQKDPKEASSDIKNYMDAEWLFQNFLGEYGMPDKLKDMMMPEFKMLANGFALQYAQGKNVENTISQFHTDMMALYYSGQLGEMVQSNIDEYEESKYGDLNGNISNEYNSTSSIREISEDAQERIQQALLDQEQYRQQQTELVSNYNLPYKILGHDTQVIVYSRTMKSKGSSSGSNTKSKPKFHRLDTMDWWDADFFWVDGAKGIGHMGLVVDAENYYYKTVIDVMPNGNNNAVQRNYDMTKYFNKQGWSKMEAYTVNEVPCYEDSSYNTIRNRITNWAKSRLGYKVGYSVGHGKRNKRYTYCSAFVWQAYMNFAHIDLDSRKQWFVWPRSITNSSHATMFDSQKIY